MHEAFRQGGPALELAQCRFAVLRQILPNPARGLTNRCLHGVLLSFNPQERVLSQQAYYTYFTAEKAKNYCSLQLEVWACGNSLRVETPALFVCVHGVFFPDNLTARKLVNTYGVLACLR
jgi:hypothetical protein